MSLTLKFTTYISLEYAFSCFKKKTCRLDVTSVDGDKIRQLYENLSEK